MIVQIWNVRGIWNSVTQQMIWFYNNTIKMDILAILEPMVPLNEVFYCKKLGFDKVVSNVNNKIWIFSRNGFDVTLLQDEDQLLHYNVSSLNIHIPCLISIIYAKCSTRKKLPFRDSLRSLNVHTSPCLMGGDFNVISNSSERIAGSPPDHVLL